MPTSCTICGCEIPDDREQIVLDHHAGTNFFCRDCYDGNLMAQTLMHMDRIRHKEDTKIDRKFKKLLKENKLA